MFYQVFLYICRANKKGDNQSNANDDSGDDSDDDDNDEPKQKKQKRGVGKHTTGAITLLTSMKIRDHFRQVWTADGNILQEVFSSLKNTGLEFGTDLFFLDVIPVPPSRFRPVSSHSLS